MKRTIMSWAQRLTALSIAAVAAVAVSIPLARADDVDIRFTLDWIAQSTHGPFFIALYEGYYEDEGLNVTLDAGKGSMDAVRRIVSGAYDMGFPDINALIQYNSENPENTIQVVLMGYEQPPFSIFTMKKSNITDPKQLVGKTLGAPVFDASYQLFPAFAAAIGIDEKEVKRKNMDPQLREPMLVRGDVDAISGHVFSSMLNLKAAGVSEDDVRYFMYGDYGMNSYGNGIAVSKAFMEKHPEAVKGFIRATIKAARDTVLHPEKAIAAVKRYEPLTDEAIEADRLRLGIECCILTEGVRKNGYGGVDMDRLARSIDQAALAFGLKRKPTAEEMFNPAFLPPPEERMIHE